MKYLNSLVCLVFLLLSSVSIYAADFGYVEDDGSVIELTRVNKLLPEYPRQAIRYGIEGSVKVQFNVDSFGAVLDPFVVDSNPPGIFERASIKAVRKLIYEPPLFEEKSVNVNNVQIDIVFKFE
tara:strand:+ start:72 stop:443 length:372 start_codon:yes stop_codon:yes gene_type:complete